VIDQCSISRAAVLFVSSAASRHLHLLDASFSTRTIAAALSIMSAATPQAMYQLICRQLQEDGFHDIAMQLAVRTDTALDQSIPTNTLAKLLASSPQPTAPTATSASPPVDTALSSAFAAASAPSVPLYQSPWMTVHKAPVRASCLHHDLLYTDAHLLAAGDDDSIIRIYDVDAIRAAADDSDASNSNSTSTATTAEPLIRTYADHGGPITALQFHPLEPFLLSTSTDCTIRFFQFSNPTYRRAYLTLSDAFPVRSAAIHPSGDFLLTGTDHPIPRLYDLHTLQAFIQPELSSQHTDAVRSVAWSGDGSMYATGSSDGDVKLLDTRTSQPIHTFVHAHSHAVINSVAFPPSASTTTPPDVLLTCGRDNTAKLWDVHTHRLLQKYTGAVHSEASTPAIFDRTARSIISADDEYGVVCMWDREGGGSVGRRMGGHVRGVRTLCADSLEEMFVSGGEDGRLRAWWVQSERGGEKQDNTGRSVKQEMSVDSHK